MQNSHPTHSKRATSALALVALAAACAVLPGCEADDATSPLPPADAAAESAPASDGGAGEAASSDGARQDGDGAAQAADVEAGGDATTD